MSLAQEHNFEKENKAMKVIQIVLSDVDVEFAIRLVKDNTGVSLSIEKAIENLLSFHEVTCTAVKDVTETN